MCVCVYVCACVCVCARACAYWFVCVRARHMCLCLCVCMRVRLVQVQRCVCARARRCMVLVQWTDMWCEWCDIVRVCACVLVLGNLKTFWDVSDKGKDMSEIRERCQSDLP